MHTFLQAVAQDLYNRFGDNLSRTAVIFPGKRAGLWMDRYLYQCAGHPLWSPAYISVDEVFGSISSLKKESQIRTICLLHKIFGQLTKSTESLDDFYFWGELMLADFDDIDKNMVEAERLFVNLADIKDLENQFDYLSTEQKELLNRFFSGLHNEKERTELKQRFIELWRVMGDIYSELSTALRTKGMAYEGMMYRDAIEQFDTSKLEYDRYVIVGFNVLNQVEKALFDKLKKSNKETLFYWDYDHYYYDNNGHEAGTFVRENIKDYGNALEDTALYDNLRHLPEINYLSASTDNAQARYLHSWLKENITEHEQDTAVVLCNEDIVQSVLHALPSEKVENVNITMGFKLTQTTLYTLIEAYLNLHTKGYDTTQNMHTIDSATALLSHPYIQQLYPESQALSYKWVHSKRKYIAPNENTYENNELKDLFVHPTQNANMLTTLTTLMERIGRLFVKSDERNTHFAQLNEEALFQLHRTIKTFKELVDEEILNISTKTLVRLMQRVMSQVSIPYHGEPAIGLQVMGVLETRNLDFKHIILLSANEGKLPKTVNASSFIPYNLREAFGMNTIQRQNAVYAYYFYRMIQRAQQVTIVYNNGTDGLTKQEPSRYIMQLQVEFPGKMKAWELSSPSRTSSKQEFFIEQTDETRRKLQEHFAYDNTNLQYEDKQHDKKRKKIYRLSPSTLNDYLDCRLRFYLKHIEGLNPPQEVNNDIDTASLGIIYHKSAELVYNHLTQRNKIITGEDIKTLLADKMRLEGFVDDAFRTEFFHIKPEEALHYNGTQLIVRHVIVSYLRKLLQMDVRRTPFQYIQSEKKVLQVHTINSHNTRLDVLLGGTIDRMDSKQDENGQEIVRILDYKTGGKLKPTKSIKDLFDRDNINRDGYVFQALYYAYLMSSEYSRISPSLLFMRNTSDETFEPQITIGDHPVNDFSIYHDQFEQLLHETIDEIFNSDVPYTPTTIKAVCEKCIFTTLCGKKK